MAQFEALLFTEYDFPEREIHTVAAVLMSGSFGRMSTRLVRKKGG